MRVRATRLEQMVFTHIDVLLPNSGVRRHGIWQKTTGTWVTVLGTIYMTFVQHEEVIIEDSLNHGTATSTI